MKSDGDRRNSGMELELQSIFDSMKSALGESELDSIIQNIASGDQQGHAKSRIKVSPTKLKQGAQTTVKPISSSSKEGKMMLEEMKKVKLIHPLIIEPESLSHEKFHCI